MALYADMDVSTIDELPPGHKPVRARLASTAWRDDMVRQVEQTCAAGGQAYWICTLIEDDEENPRHAAEAAFQFSNALPARHVALAHGRLPPTKKPR